MTHEPREEERARGRTRSRTQDSGDRSQDSASRAVSRRPRRAKPLGHEDNVRIHRPRSRAAERLPSPVQGAAVSSAEGWGCTPHTPRFTQHRCTHTASLSIAAHTPLHSASLHTHRIVATGWQTLERRSLPLKRKSHFFLTSPRGRRASDLLKEEEQQPGAHRLHVLRSCINTHKKCLHFLS